MASARQDFERYVRWLYQPEKQVPEDVRRLATLALQNFDELAGTSRQRSQRSSYLVALVRTNLANTVAAPPAEALEANAGTWPWVKLRHLTLGPFRGFRTPEPFDLSKQIILFYGPNGSGKTSLCEGLEYALLGDVEEAGNKRIAARTYLANVHDRRFVPPVLKATDQHGREVDVVASLDTYRFCFIEKNRIDAFSRIAARPNAQRAELIATLFGMDQFNEFVGHFNESIDGQLVLIGERQNTLAARRNALAADRTTVESEAESQQVLADEEAALAREYAPDTTYEALKNLIGTAEAPGRLQELDSILEAVPPNVLGITRQGLMEALDKAQRCGEELDAIVASLRAKSDQVSFKALYDSVLALREVVGERCPACDTPLDGQPHVATDPYQKATDGLRQLQELGALQDRQQTAETLLGQASRELRQMFAPIATFLTTQAEEDSATGRWIAQLQGEPVGRWWSVLHPAAAAPEAGAPSLAKILAVVDRMAAQDDTSRRAQQDRLPHIAERRRLSEFQLRVQAQDLKRQQLTENVEAAKGRIKAFDETNAELIAQAEQEKLDIARDAPFKVAYDRFLEELRAYRDQLPEQLMTGLNDAAKDLYNAFNRNDRDEDKLSALHLPLTGDGKIEISFRGNPDARMDALHVLSEGHIRCLGLAILMAKAKSIGCPVIVFDDAINAIDHDHRGGIREAIFESDQFAQTQLIVTCHSNEFIKDIQQHLPVQRRGSCQVYLFRHHDGNYQPRVAGNIPTANYIAKARAAREVLNDREALAASRQALEMLSEKTWRWLGSHDQGLLNLLLAGVGAEPALRNLCEALVKKLRDAQTFNHTNKDPLMTAYGRVLGIPVNNLVWTYLNKGTHEEAERDDFDGELVETVVQTLEELDRLDLRPGR
ncbi:AAA family ATPase [Pseudomonas aeruginosa]|uniref:AAA family ATPase n=1 Tax=Pseudomonas aeruginosa TaxID=287 RepID=UPI001909C845|nr:AAA family ATPase [Pseudomonas aeruginosa]MBK3752823.1 AAA family ATPase [Pseudomonas aeruginosa]MBK3763061.1 AAA family ATPase [Pseudomonas aeruginosa]MBK3769601.1 AAA family ATPase [Pseudomonas aeruginosa]MBK3789789.1 AAA family ATPase [Pseudomonas aeruginosa]MBK3885835.1 AAA family ATPase [Pseudomonas aeruginosa]